MAETDLGLMSLPLCDSGSTTLLMYGHWPNEVRETKLVGTLAAECEVMIDIGAHAGWYTRLMSLSASALPNRRIFAFEPHTRMIKTLRANCQNLRDVICIHAAVSSSSGSTILYQARSSVLSSIARKVGLGVPVQAITLDDFVKANHLEQVDFVKCDVEGAEVLVLEGARQLLRSRWPPIWMLEVCENLLADSGFTTDDLMRQLNHETGGGTLFSQDSQGNPVGIDSVSQRIISNNVFFVPDQRLPQFYKAAETLRARNDSAQKSV